MTDHRHLRGGASPHHLVLASASPRRRELLRQIGIDATVLALDVPEEEIDPTELHASGIHHDDLPGEVSLRRTRMKYAAASACSLPRLGVPGNTPILCADTVVYRDGAVFDKPFDEADARRMIEALSDGSHIVSTAVILGNPRYGAPHEEIVETVVTFSAISPDEIDGYIDSGEWQGVAGGYRIQGHAAAFATHLSGSYPSVMGLPIHTVYSMIKRFSDGRLR
ncbi:MAG: Maf family protein [Alkalispirochaeta sp.]